MTLSKKELKLKIKFHKKELKKLQKKLAKANEKRIGFIHYD